MLSNMPCRGCWWFESRKCFNDKLGAVPRFQPGEPYTPEKYGMEVTDALLERCIADGPQARYRDVLGGIAKQLADTGIEVAQISVVCEGGDRG